MARRVAILDGHDLLGHRSSHAMAGRGLGLAYHRSDLSSELQPGQPRPKRVFTHAKRALESQVNGVQHFQAGLGAS